MSQPGIQQGGEALLWWKVALHLDEAQLALANVTAHNLDDPRLALALQERLREGQAILLEIFRAKGLLPTEPAATEPLVVLPSPKPTVGATPSPEVPTAVMPGPEEPSARLLVGGSPFAAGGPPGGAGAALPWAPQFRQGAGPQVPPPPPWISQVPPVPQVPPPAPPPSVESTIAASTLEGLPPLPDVPPSAKAPQAKA